MVGVDASTVGEISSRTGEVCADYVENRTVSPDFQVSQLRRKPQNAIKNHSLKSGFNGGR